MNLDKTKRDWEHYCKETEENDYVDIDLHYSMAMEVGSLLRVIEQFQQENAQFKTNHELLLKEIDRLKIVEQAYDAWKLAK
jgi:hypothetical protein